MSYAIEQAKLTTERGKENASRSVILGILDPLVLKKDLTLNYFFEAYAYIADGKIKINKKLFKNNRESLLPVSKLPEIILLAYANQVQAILEYENGTRLNFPR